jgi:hypothetical protein
MICPVRLVREAGTDDMSRSVGGLEASPPPAPPRCKRSDEQEWHTAEAMPAGHDSAGRYCAPKLSRRRSLLSLETREKQSLYHQETRMHQQCQPRAPPSFYVRSVRLVAAPGRDSGQAKGRSMMEHLPARSHKKVPS